MVAISIILPVFNAEDTLKGAFNSIFNQTFGFENLEVIFVDDCSTDSSAEIIKNYTKIYSNVKYICLEKNSGFAGKPRNIGIENATADYLMFLDPDDEFLENACSLLYSNIINTNLDVVSGNYIKFFHNKEYPNEWNNLDLKEGVLEIDDIKKQPNIFTNPASVWTKIFRKDFIIKNHIDFPVGIPAQDLVFVYHALLKSKGIKFIDTPIVKYIQRDNMNGSVTLNRNERLLSGYIKAYSILYDLFKENNVDLIHFSLIHLNFWSKQFSLSNLDEKIKLKLLEEANPLFQAAKSIDYIPQNHFRLFFKKNFNKDYQGALEVSKELSLIFDENEDIIFEKIKSKEIIMLFFGFDIHIGGLASAVCNKSKLFVDNGYSVTLLNIDDFKNFNFIQKRFINEGYLYDSIKFYNIYDYYSRKNTIDSNIANKINFDNKINGIMGEFFVEKIIHEDESTSLNYHDCSKLDDCSKYNKIKEEIYLNNYLACIKFYENSRNVSDDYYTPDGFKYLSCDYKNKIFNLYSRQDKVVTFNKFSEFRDYFVTEICSQFKEKPFLINESSSSKPSIKNIDSDVAYKIGNVHSNPYSNPPYCFSSRMRNISSLKEYKYLDAVVVLTNSAKLDFNQEFKSNKFHVIPNFVFENDEFVEGGKNIVENKTFSIFSRISPEKNIEDLLFALNRVLKKHPDAKLKIYGRALKPSEIKEKDKLDSIISKLDISNSVEFMGHVDNVDVEIQNSLATLLVSRIEGLPMVILESMINATPVIAYDINYGPRDVIINNVNGFVVNQYDIDELSEAMIDFLDNPKKAFEMGLNARQHILDNFSSVSVLERWNSLFKKIYINNLIKKNKEYKINKAFANDTENINTGLNEKRGFKMGLMNKFLSKSNSYNYYKDNYHRLSKENSSLKSKNAKLKSKNDHLKNKVEEVGVYYTKKINDINKSLHNKQNEVKHTYSIIVEKNRELASMNQKIKEKDKEITKLYYYAPKDIGRKWLYKKRMGKELDLENPKDFNEKINWLIVNKYGEREGKLSDKNLVKDYVKNKNIEGLFIPQTYKIYKTAEDIDIGELPDKFVLKCNHGSGLVFVCNNKENFDIDNAKAKLQESLNENYAFRGLEYHYDYIEPCIIAEEYLDDKEHLMPLDYKFYSFNGKVENILVCSEREKQLRLDDFDLEWNLRDFTLPNWKSSNVIKKPNNLDKMIKISEELGKEFSFVRVDLYEINNKIYFGELTFTPGNATIDYYKQEALDYLGKKIIIN